MPYVKKWKKTGQLLYMAIKIEGEERWKKKATKQKKFGIL